MAAIPIFVLGRHRSGTTWLANILAARADVFAPAHEAHAGVHESAFFSHLVRHCNHGRTAEDRRKIQRLFEASDFFMLTGLAAGPGIEDRDPAGYFRAVMDAAAAARGATFWVEKTPAHTTLVRYLARAFPDARFVAMVRGYREVVTSNVHAFGNPASAREWFRQSLVTAAYEKVLAANRIAVVRYEDLRDDYERTVRAVLRHLGMDAGTVQRSDWAPNTRFAGASPPIRAWQSLAMGVGRWLLLPLPARWVEAVIARRERSRPAALPPWFFRLRGAPAQGEGPPK